MGIATSGEYLFSAERGISESDRQGRGRKRDLRTRLGNAVPLPSLEACTETQPLAALFSRVEPRIQAIFALSNDTDNPEDAWQEALITLSAGKRDLSEPWREAAQQLRSLLYWRRRQRRIGMAVDAAILEILRSESCPVELRSGLRKRLGSYIEALPHRCRSLLRLRYGLDIDTDHVTLGLGSTRAGMRKLTRNCLVGLAELVIRARLETT